MPIEVTPRKFQNAVQMGFRRLENFRNARLLFLRNYVGQYYDKDRGSIGTEPLNMIFNAIRVLVPNLVMTLPKHTIRADFLAYREYAELLAMALNYSDKEIGMRDIYRRWVVDSLFCMGIVKTGMCESNRVIFFDEDDRVDPGTVYTEIVNFDNFVFSKCDDLRHATWVGDRIRVPRQQLLDSGLYNNDLVKQLPKSGTEVDDGSEKLSRRNVSKNQEIDLQDDVDVVEIWIPNANALVTVPGSRTTFDEYLRIADYYGPEEGPYTYLKMTPPVPDNPIPIAPVAMWNDLHMLANRMAVKIVQQAERQKDVLGYKPSAADDAQEILDSEDGDTIKLNEPKGAQMFSFGGQQRSNEAHIQQLMLWFNLMSGNTEALGGLRENSATATQAQILAANQSIGIGDMKDITYQAVAEEARKRAWYMHSDPLIEIPLIRRRQIPAQYAQGLMGPQMVQPAQFVDEQVILTPEVRKGHFIDFHFSIEPKSMSRLDPHLRFQRCMEFAIKAIPAAATAAQICFQMGVPFSFPKFVVKLAKEADIEWMDEVFYDPEFQMRMAEIMMKTPGFAGSQGQIAGQIQNNQPPGVAKVPTAASQPNREAQAGAVASQSAMATNERY